MNLVFHEQMTKDEVYDQLVKFHAVKLANSCLEIAESDSSVSKAKLEIYRQEVQNLENKMSDELMVFSDDDEGVIRETTDEPGKITDSGDERSMDMQMSKKELKETVAEGTAQGIRMAEAEEKEILNAARRTGYRESSLSTDYHEHLDPDSPKYKGEPKKNLDLTESNVLEIVKGDR